MPETNTQSQKKRRPYLIICLIVFGSFLVLGAIPTGVYIYLVSKPLPFEKHPPDATISALPALLGSGATDILVILDDTSNPKVHEIVRLDPKDKSKDKVVNIWNKVNRYMGLSQHNGPAWVNFSPDGSRYASKGFHPVLHKNKGKAYILVHRFIGEEDFVIETKKLDHEVYGPYWSPDGTQIAHYEWDSVKPPTVVVHTLGEKKPKIFSLGKTPGFSNLVLDWTKAGWLVQGNNANGYTFKWIDPKTQRIVRRVSTSQTFGMNGPYPDPTGRFIYIWFRNSHGFLFGAQTGGLIVNGEMGQALALPGAGFMSSQFLGQASWHPSGDYFLVCKNVDLRDSDSSTILTLYRRDGLEFQSWNLKELEKTNIGKLFSNDWRGEWLVWGNDGCAYFLMTSWGSWDQVIMRLDPFSSEMPTLHRTYGGTGKTPIGLHSIRTEKKPPR